jgi:hypothetical protein
MMRIRFRALLAVLCSASAVAPLARAADTPKSVRSELRLVTSFGPGAIPLPQTADWKPEMLTVYDDGRRPAAQFSNESHKVGVSFLLFENRSGTPGAKGCREDAISPLVKSGGSNVTERRDGDDKLADGTDVATTSYLLTMTPGQGSSGRQRSLFAFVGNATTCAEMHISSVVDTPEQRSSMKALLKEFKPDLGYRPVAIDYFHIGQLLFKASPKFAAPYFRASLGAMPADESYTTPRRMTTDQLVMSLGMSGDVKGSRALAEKAVAADPDYPINYYNLACADAEEGDAASARKHLQDAFDRRKNVIQGESMPDPSIDDSIVKLKNDKAFWDFVQSLPKN